MAPIARLLCALSIFLSLHPNAVAEDQAPNQVARLVSSVGYVAMLKAKAETILREAAPPLTQSEREAYEFASRVKVAREDELLPAFVEAFQGHVTEQEAQAVAELFETPFGRKLSRVSVETSSKFGGNVQAARAANPLTEEERVEMKALSATDAWRVYQRIAAADRQYARRLAPLVLKLPAFDGLR